MVTIQSVLPRVGDRLRKRRLLNAPLIHPAEQGFFGRLLSLLLRWQARAEERQALAELDERLLRDIGLERVEALREARKPFWRP